MRRQENDDALIKDLNGAERGLVDETPWSLLLPTSCLWLPISLFDIKLNYLILCWFDDCLECFSYSPGY